MSSTGNELEQTSLGWIDQLTGLGDGTTKQTNATLAVSTEQMLGQLRGTYTKIIDSNGTSNGWSAKQLTARIENTIELLPPAEQKRLGEVYKRDLSRAQEMGRKAGLDLDKALNEKDSVALGKNAKPNIDAMNASGRRLEEFWKKENSQFTDRVKAITRNGLAQGHSWKKLSKQIRELLINDTSQSKESKAKNQKMGVSKRADLIARTELAHSFIQGQMDNYRSMGYEHVRWSAAAERTCGYCMSRDGLVYLMEEIENAIPAHPRCRCSLIPVDAESLKKPKGPTGPDAANDLDDSYWTKSRNDKLSRWKQENAGIKDPKTEAILDNMLRNYARTPTNTEKYLRPGAEAAKPKWAPSGEVIPNVAKAAVNAKQAAENQEIKAEKKRLEEDAKELEREEELIAKQGQVKAATKQADALAAKVTPKRLEDRIAQKVISPKGGKIKGKDFGDALRLASGAGGLTGVNFQRMMRFQERYNISTITGTGNEAVGYLLGSKQLLSSLKAAGLQGSGSAGNAKAFKNAAEELDYAIKNPGKKTDFDTFTKRDLKVNKQDGINGSTAAGMGAVKIKISDFHKAVDAKALKKLQDAVEDGVNQAAKGTPLRNGASAAQTLTIQRKKYSFKAGESNWLTTYVHEMGHQIHYAVGSPMPTGKAAQWKPSKYGTTNKQEWFAETFMQYTLAPNALKKASPEAYKFVDDAVKRALVGKPGSVAKAVNNGQKPPEVKAGKQDFSKETLIKTPSVKATVKEMKQWARDTGAKGWWALTKPQLVEMIGKANAQAPAVKATAATVAKAAPKASIKPPAKATAKAAAPKAEVAKPKAENKTTAKAEATQKADLSKQTAASLKKQAQAAGVKQWWSKTKPELVELLSASPAAAAPAPKAAGIKTSKATAKKVAEKAAPKPKAEPKPKAAPKAKATSQWGKPAPANGKYVPGQMTIAQAEAVISFMKVGGMKLPAHWDLLYDAKNVMAGKLVKLATLPPGTDWMPSYDAKPKGTVKVELKTPTAAPKTPAKPKTDTAAAKKKAKEQAEEAEMIIKFLGNQSLTGTLSSSQLTSLKNNKAKLEAANKILGVAVPATTSIKGTAKAASKSIPGNPSGMTKGQAKDIMLDFGDADPSDLTTSEWNQLTLATKIMSGMVKAAPSAYQPKSSELAAEKAKPLTGKIAKSTTDVNFRYHQAQYKQMGYKTPQDYLDALKSVRNYTGVSYGDIKREQLRNQPAATLSAYEKSTFKGFIKDTSAVKDAVQIEGFIRRAPKYKGEIHRGIKVGSEADAMAAIKHLAKGGAGSMESWSNERGVAEDFGTRSGMVSIILNVVNKHGAPVAGSSRFARESEVIVPQGVKYRIKRTKKKTINHEGEEITRFEVDLEMI